jgi:hypothetical protein
LSSVAENNLLSEKLISNYISNKKNPSRMSTPPKTPATVGSKSPEAFFATPDGSMEYSESELEETVNQIIAGMVPSPMSSRKSFRNLGNVSKSLEEKMADIREFEEENEQGVKHKMQQSLSGRLATCVGKAFCKKEVGNIRKIKRGIEQERKQSKSERSATCFRKASCKKEIGNLKKIKRGIEQERQQSKSESLTRHVEKASCKKEIGNLKKIKRGIEQERQQSKSERLATHVGKASSKKEIDSHRKNVSGVKDDPQAILREMEVAPFVYWDGVERSITPSIYSRRLDDGTDPRTDSQFEMSEVKGTRSFDSDSISDFSSFMTDCNWEHEEEKSRIANSSASPFSKDVQLMISDLGATFGNARSGLLQTFNFVDPLPDDSNKNTMPMSWLSPCQTISRVDSCYSAFHYGSTPDDDVSVTPSVDSFANN